jgi:DNA invertase Pin-like site-specific DNA recombinase
MSARHDSPLRAIGYCRRSRERENGYGLDTQKDALRRWADYKQAEMVAVIPDDDVSGVADPMQREGLSRALGMLEAGKADALVVAKFDRLARSLTAFAEVLKLSQEQGWALVCLDPDMDFGRAAGRAMGAMLIAFADIEREAFTDRMQGGRRAKMARGGYGGGQRLHRRFGFELAPQREGGYEWQPVPEEQDVITRIVGWRGEGHTLQAIADRLTRAGVAAPSGPAWNAVTIMRIAKRAAAPGVAKNPHPRGQHT